MKKLIFAFICLFLVIPSQARIITVNDDGPADFNNIQAAINDSNDGDMIIVADGTYTGPSNRDIDFLGKAITVRSSDPNDPDIVAATIIDCQGTNSERHRGFKFHTAEGPESILAGVTIINGYGPEEELGYFGTDRVGGAIFCDDSSPTITKCTISNNKGMDFGGGIFCYRGSPIIANCAISSNTAYDGGGIFCYQSSPTIASCDIISNLGGGIYCWESNANITNCTISNNSNGGIGCEDSSPTITGCTITGNSTEHGGGGISGCEGPITNSIITNNSAEEGGGLHECHGPVTNCIITDNTAEDGGGLAWCGASLTNCVISNNTAEFSGGFYICWGPIINCIVSNNRAKDAGGLYGCDGPITNCTITGNRAEGEGYSDGHGGGLYGGGKTTNCIIWDNWPDQIYGSPIVTYSNVQGGWPGQGNIDQDPYFALDTDYHIMPASPCIDAGTNDPCSGLPATDIEGITRPLDGDGDGNAVADMGAYEYTPDSPSIAVSAISFYFAQDWPKPEPQTLLIRNCGSEPLHWEITEDCNWLQISPANGVSTDQINEVIITVDPNGFAPGLYSYDFDVRDPSASNNPVTIRVIMPVGGILPVPSQDFNTIQDAIDAADNYDIVLVADGNYTGEGNTNLDFRGKPITVKSENGPNNCFIDCQNSDYGFYFQNEETENAVVNGFTITNAYAGIRCYIGSPTIKNCTIRDNSDSGILCMGPSYPAIANCTISDNGGCGISYCFRCYEGMLSATIINCTVSNNSGGGISTGCCRGTLTITNSTITHNLNDDYEYSDGGGIYCKGCRLTVNSSIITDNSIADSSPEEGGGGITCGGGSKITNCNISGNSADELGGGIYCRDNPTITNCTITGNTAGVSGGGICCGDNSNITNCTITGNTAGGSGGGISCSGNTTITDCTISGNSSDGWGWGGGRGGGIYYRVDEEDDNLTITNCIVTANSANERGAGICCLGNATITNCTIASNTADEYGGGIFCYGGNPTITNCILWANKALNGGPEIYLEYQSNTSVSYTDVEGGQAAVYINPGCTLNWLQGNIDKDPCFADPNNGDYHLRSEGWSWDIKRSRWTYDDVTSRCIDAGNPGSPLADEPITIPDDPNNIWGQNLRINMGAYGGTAEASIPPYDWALLADLNNDGKVDSNDLAAFVNYWLSSSECIPSDLNRNQLVDMLDFALLAQDWLKQTTWHE